LIDEVFVEFVKSVQEFITNMSSIARIFSVGGLLVAGLFAANTGIALVSSALVYGNGVLNLAMAKWAAYQVTQAATPGLLTKVTKALYGQGLAATSASGAMGKLSILAGAMFAAYAGYELGTEVYKKFQIQIQDALESPIQFAKEAGLKLVVAFAEGILSAKLFIWDALFSVFDFVSSLFPHSDAETGPFSDLYASGQALISTFANGLASGGSYLAKTIEATFNSSLLSFDEFTNSNTLIKSISSFLSETAFEAGKEWDSFWLNFYYKGAHGYINYETGESWYIPGMGEGIDLWFTGLEKDISWRMSALGTSLSTNWEEAIAETTHVFGLLSSSLSIESISRKG